MWKGFDYLETKKCETDLIIWKEMWKGFDKKEGRCSKIRKKLCDCVGNKEENRCWKIRNKLDRRKLCDCVSTIYKETYT